MFSNIVSKVGNAAKLGAGIAGAAIAGGSAAKYMGDLATNTKYGADLGKSIGDNYPAIKSAANALKPVQNAIRSATGINQPEAPTSKGVPGPVPAAAPKPAPVKEPVTAKAPAAGTAKPAPVAAKPSAGLQGKNLQSTISNIAQANKIKDVNKIYAGKTIDVGGGDKYTIQKGDTLTKIAKGFYGGSKPTPTAPAKPAKLGGSDEQISMGLRQTNNRSVMKPGADTTMGDVTKTPIQQQAKTASASPLAAARQSPGSTADLAKSVSPPSEPTTSMPTPSKVQAQFGSSQDLAKDTSSVKSMKNPTIKEEVQVGTNKYRIV